MKSTGPESGPFKYLERRRLSMAFTGNDKGQK